MKNMLIFAVSIILFFSCEMKKSNHIDENRFEQAKTEKSEIIQSLFESKNINPKTAQLFLRAFKNEKQLELWAKNPVEKRFKKLKSYPFCKLSGQLGPKRREGDRQVPEGLYHIDRFNEKSKFHLSLGINYPNKSDKILGNKIAPGSDIFIHGKCETIGCIPITDFWIKELFVIAKTANEWNQSKIQVHIFPFKMTESNFQKMIAEFPEHEVFWSNLKPCYQSFEQENSLMNYSIDDKGNYKIEQ